MLKISSNTLTTWCEELSRKEPDARKDWGQEKKGAAEDETVRWYPWLNGREFEQIPGDSEGPWSASWGRKVRYYLATEQQQRRNNQKAENMHRVS